MRREVLNPAQVTFCRYVRRGESAVHYLQAQFYLRLPGKCHHDR